MILVDLNQVMIANMMMALGNHRNAEIEEGMVRHMILNSIRSIRTKFKSEFGELVICCDDKNYWRRDIFPHYKAGRKTGREKSEIDWHSIFVALNKIREEIKAYFPYKVIQVPKAEADDIIGTLVHKFGTALNGGSVEKLLILSGDKDYVQLHTYGNVSQYDPTRKKWIKHSNPAAFLFEHIVRGDAGDGVPNALSADDSFVNKKRQKPVTQKRLTEFANINTLSDEALRGYKRNEALIDLSKIPQSITDQVMEAYESADQVTDRSLLLPYFMEHKLKHLTRYLGDF